MRRLARDVGVDLDLLRGPGRWESSGGADVEAARGRGRHHLGEPPWTALAPVVDDTDRAHGTVIRPVRGVRKAIADKMSRSRPEIPEATVWVDVDATALVETRAHSKPDSAPAGEPAGPAGPVLPQRPGAVPAAQHPGRHRDGSEIVRSRRVNLGFAAQTDRGLMVPSVRDAQKLSTAELVAELAGPPPRPEPAPCPRPG